MNRKTIEKQLRAEAGLEEPKKKVRRRRKPMTEEQKKAAAERLAKAREKRMKENPPEMKSVHPDVLALDDDHPWSLKNVRQWIKTQKELLSAERAAVRGNVKGALAKATNHEGYIRNLQTYIRTGTYIDLFYGEHMQSKVKNVCVKMAYYEDGTPKRNHGTYYPDIGMTWDSLTMDEKDYRTD
jgi:hypothetical protein